MVLRNRDRTVHGTVHGTVMSVRTVSSSGTVQEMFTYRRMNKLTTETTGNVRIIARTGQVSQ